MLSYRVHCDQVLSQAKEPEKSLIMALLNKVEVSEQKIDDLEDQIVSLTYKLMEAQKRIKNLPPET